jgi:integrase
MPYLQKQYNTYYAVWDIPAKDRPKFDGKRRLTKTLKTEDKKIAQRKAYAQVEIWKRQAEGSFWDRVRADYPEDGEPWVVGVHNGNEITEPFNAKEHLTDILTNIANNDEVDDAISSDDFRVAVGDLIRFSDYLEPWFKGLTATPKTNDQKRTDVSSFTKEFPYPHLVTRKKLKSWLEGKGKATNTLTRALGSIKGFWTFCEVELDTELGDPFKNINVIGNKGIEKEAFTYKEISRIYNTLKDEDQKLIVHIAALSGMRIEEICSATYEGTQIKIKKSKTEAGVRIIPLHSALDVNTIREMQGRLKAGAYGRLSHSVSKKLNRAITRLGFGPEKTFHCIRGYVATCFENANIDELKAARVLGHNIKTMTYGLYSGGRDVEGLRSVVQELVPLKAGCRSTTL